jgi:hypothetical protein
MKTSHFVPGLICIFILSCGSATYENSTGDSTAIETTAKVSDEPQHSIQANDSNETTSNAIVFNGANPVTDWDKKIIKTANAQVECKDYKTYNQQVHALARQHDGWIAAESESQTNERINNTMTIKVPVPQFEELMMAISNLDGRMMEKTINTEDVTARIIDTKGRIAVRREMRDKYIDLLHDTKKIDDALKVQRELNDMHEDIEMASNQLQGMQVQAAYSTVNLHYYQLVAVANEPVADAAPGLGTRVLEAASGGGSWLVDVMVGLISIWPILLLLGLVVFFVRKRWHTTTGITSKIE